MRYGVSFDRRLFEEFGLFDDTMRVAEDTEFLKRLPLELAPIWEPEVRTIHRNETGLLGLIVDQCKRGYRNGAYSAGTTQTSPFKLARSTFRDRRQVRKLARIGLSGAERTFAMRLMPVVSLVLFVKSVGVYLGARNHWKKRTTQG